MKFSGVQQWLRNQFDPSQRLAFASPEWWDNYFARSQRQIQAALASPPQFVLPETAARYEAFLQQAPHAFQHSFEVFAQHVQVLKDQLAELQQAIDTDLANAPNPAARMLVQNNPQTKERQKQIRQIGYSVSTWGNADSWRQLQWCVPSVALLQLNHSAFSEMVRLYREAHAGYTYRWLIDRHTPSFQTWAHDHASRWELERMMEEGEILFHTRECDPLARVDTRKLIAAADQGSDVTNLVTPQKSCGVSSYLPSTHWDIRDRVLVSHRGAIFVCRYTTPALCYVHEHGSLPRPFLPTGQYGPIIVDSITDSVAQFNHEELQVADRFWRAQDAA